MDLMETCRMLGTHPVVTLKLSNFRRLMAKLRLFDTPWRLTAIARPGGDRGVPVFYPDQNFSLDFT